jgi:acyl-[acyl carrier protein]--UDP-N-acetylglucosamine O-acyltransferase
MLDVSGATTMNATLSVADATYLGSTLSVAQSAFVGTFLDVSGAVTMNSTLSVADTVYLGSTLSVAQSAFVGTLLDVSGATTMNSTLSVAGAVNLDVTLSVAQSAFVGTLLDVSGAVTMNSTLSVTDSTFIGSTLDVYGSATMNSTLSIAGAVYMNSTLDVSDNICTKGNIILKKASENIVMSHLTDASGNSFVQINSAVDSTVGFTVNGSVLTGGEVIPVYPILEKYGDFEPIHGVEGTDDMTEFLTGVYTFSDTYDWNRNGWRWKAFYSPSSDMIIPDASGYVDTDTSTQLSSGNTPNNIYINLVDNSGNYITQNVFVAPDSSIDTPLTTADITFAQVYNPSSLNFAYKAATDFDAFFNSGAINTQVQLINTYVSMASNNNSLMHKSGTKSYVITFIAGYSLRDVTMIGDTSMSVKYYAPDNKQDRLTKVYVVGTDNAYTCDEDPSGSIVFPYVSFLRWKNDVNSPAFFPVGNTARMHQAIGMGGDTTMETVFDTLTAKNWAFPLYERTYYYILQGQCTPPNSFTADDLEELRGHYDALPGNSLRYVRSDTIGGTTDRIAYAKDAFGWMVGI